MKKRIISACIMLCICLPVIIIGKTPFYILAILVSLMGLREIINLNIDNRFIKVISYLVFISIIMSNIFKINFDNLIDYRLIGSIFLMFPFLMLLNYKDNKFDVMKGLYLFGVTIFLAISFSIMIINRNISLHYFIYLVLISCFTDIFAQLVGSRMGNHKINKISPNKSWEGVLGGLVFGSLLSSIYYFIFINCYNPYKIILVSMFLSVIGQMGDLFFSLIKRQNGVKDYSNLIPGHGGILDRLDNIIFVMLASTIIITIL